MFEKYKAVCEAHQDTFQRSAIDLDQITEIEVYKQHKNIDVLCVVSDGKGNKYALVIEDKTGTINHSSQLVRYLAQTNKEYSEDNIIAVYYKTEDQADYSDVIGKKYAPFTRDEDILPALDNYQGENPILCD